jgi:hypothetical protein
MNKADLIALGVSEEVAGQVIVLHGKDIESHKTQIASAQAASEALRGQLAEADKVISGFKELDVDGIRAAADTWKAKAEQAEGEAAAKLSALKFDHALDGALSGAKARNATSVKALLSKELLKLQEDGTLSGLAEQLEKIKAENDYLFESATPLPKIVTGGGAVSVVNDPIIAAARKAAGLKDA